MDRDWYQITFDVDEVARGEHERFINGINQIYESSGKPEKFALFRKRNQVPEGCWIGFLTPVASQHCEPLCREHSYRLLWRKPDQAKDDLYWIAGDEEVGRILLSDYQV
jgi:hypothetical protein